MQIYLKIIASNSKYLEEIVHNMHQFYNIHSHLVKENNDTILTIQNLYDNFDKMDVTKFYSIGLHPWYLNNYEENLNLLKKHSQNKYVLAIGECGLDYLCNTDKQLQMKAFKEQIQLAVSLNKPLIIHCVKAFEDGLKQLNELKYSIPVLFHGFNNNATIAKRLIDKQYYLSFGTSILRDKNAELLKSINPNYFFLETDTSTIEIEELYTTAAQIRNTDKNDIILQIQQNFKRVFLNDN